MTVVNEHERRMVCLAAAQMDGSGWKALVESKVTPEMLSDSTCADIYRYALQRHRLDNRYPSKKVLRQKFVDFQWTNVNESLTLLVDEFKEWRKSSRVFSLLTEGIKTYQTDPQQGFKEAMALLESGLKDIQSEDVEETGDVLTDDADAFWDLMDKRRDTSGDIIPLGIPGVDSTMAAGGFRPGQLLVIVALDKVGKSTLSMQLGINIHDAGRSVIYQTYEMDEEETLERFVSQRLKVAPTRLAKGSLKRSEEDRVEDFFDGYETGDLQPMRITRNLSDLAAVESYAEKYKPDVIVIDGAYMMDLPSKDSRTQEIELMLKELLGDADADLAFYPDQSFDYAILSETLQTMRRPDRVLEELLRIGKTYHAFVIITTQANKDRMRGHQLNSGSAADSSAWQRYAHMVLGLERTSAIGGEKGEVDDTARTVRILNSRTGSAGDEIPMTWDWGTQTFEEMGPDE